MYLFFSSFIISFSPFEHKYLYFQHPNWKNMVSTVVFKSFEKIHGKSEATVKYDFM